MRSSTVCSLLIKVFFLGILILGPVQITVSQVVNIERHRVDVDTVRIWTGGLGFGLNISQNKTQVIRFNTSADLTYVAQKHDYILLGRNNFLRVEGDNVLNDGFVHLRSVLFRDNTFAPELFLQAQYNLDWGLKRRALSGANVRMRMHQTDKSAAFISTGFMYEHEFWEDTDDGSQEIFNHIKSTTSVNVRAQISEGVHIAAISYYQARPTRFFHPRFTSDWQLRFRISQNLHFALQFVSTYDADPPLSSTQFIYSIYNLLEIRF